MPVAELNVGGVRDRNTIVRLNAYWRDIRLAYDGSGNIVYRGVNHSHDALSTDTNWEIWKYTWGSDGIDRIEGPLSGSWDGRAALAWG